MIGYINSIWLTQSGNTLPNSIVTNLKSWSLEAKTSDFGVVFWTNINEIAPEIVKELESCDVIVKDHNLCVSSSIYKYFLFFLDKAINGDKVAFALASDILRMSIMDITDQDEYFIYADPNDTIFSDLKKNLSQLAQHMRKNTFGFSFAVYSYFLYDTFMYIDIRNDVLIAYKAANPDFFINYFATYLQHIEKSHIKYVKAATNDQAEEMANSISNQTSDYFFKLIKEPLTLFRIPYPMLKATFGNYEELSPIINCLSILPYKRDIKNTYTWLIEKRVLPHQRQLTLHNEYTVIFEQSIVMRHFAILQKDLQSRYGDHDGVKYAKIIQTFYEQNGISDKNISINKEGHISLKCLAPEQVNNFSRGGDLKILESIDQDNIHVSITDTPDEIIIIIKDNLRSKHSTFNIETPLFTRTKEVFVKLSKETERHRKPLVFTEIKEEFFKLQEELKRSCDINDVFLLINAIQNLEIKGTSVSFNSPAICLNNLTSIQMNDLRENLNLVASYSSSTDKPFRMSESTSDCIITINTANFIQDKVIKNLYRPS